MTDAAYIVTSLTWALYGLTFGFAAGTIYRLFGTMNRR